MTCERSSQCQPTLKTFIPATNGLPPRIRAEVSVVAGDIMQQLWKNMRNQAAKLEALECVVRTQASLLEI
eukprot:5208535-Amphidinium_carterae.1